MNTFFYRKIQQSMLAVAPSVTFSLERKTPKFINSDPEVKYIGLKNE